MNIHPAMSIVWMHFTQVFGLHIQTQDNKYRRPGRLSQFLHAAEGIDLYDYRPGAGSVEEITKKGKAYLEQHKQCV